ncbi:NUC173 domain-containing protein [Elsinoe australis]|uniref:NUC173 domain-containing protein n=1 Tax=Elsinoe australis TaxID=40998 RepID=A0A4U7AQN3_9PEZI|nr:NUC173 domain-containing protein [Elsinoe australis]
MSLTERLDKIRSQPKLQNQQHNAVVLASIEDTLRSQNADLTPTAYFAALLSLLPQYLSGEKIINKDLAHAVVYLLDLITPHVPAPLVRAKFTQILAGLAPALTHADAEAPLSRSAIGCLESILIVQDSQAWSLPASSVSPRRAVAGLLGLSIDSRPKVRKRALDALTKVLLNPPPSPSLDHPAADQCAEAALRTLADEAAKAGRTKRNRAQKEGHEPQLIHGLQLIKTISSAQNGWPSRKIDALCELLLDIAKSSSEYLVMAAFEVFELLFSSLANELSSAKLPRLLEVITELQPSKEDAQLLPPWIAVLSRAYDVAGQIDAEDTFQKLPGLFEMVAAFLSSGSHNIRISASECLVSFLSNCIPDSVILEPSIMDEKIFERLARNVDDLLSVRYQAAWMEVFNVVGAMFEAFKWRSNPSLRNALKAIGDLRGNDAFAGKKEADTVISAAIRAAGPDFVLEVLPLNLNTKQRQAGRAWMLPLMRTAVRNTRLAHFRQELVPLSEAMFQRVLDHGDAAKTMQVKIFETIVQQIWDTLPGYCELPLDVTEAFDQSFAELLANLLYQQPQLRTNVCRALQNIVVSNQAVLALGGEDDLIAQGQVSKAQAQQNLDHLAGFASNLLAVLFNVYGETLPQYRGLILQCINAYLSIIPVPELTETFIRVSDLLSTAITEEGSQTQADKQKKQANEGPKMPPTSHTLMDLIITMSIHLPRATYPQLFSIASTVINKDNDPQLQKKAYKLIPRLSESEVGRDALSSRSEELQSLLITAAPTATSPARHDRLQALSVLIPLLPATDLSFIPSIISEVVIAVKEVNEKARTSAFDLLVLMARRMSSGGTVRNNRIPHMPDNAPDVPASLEEFVTMLSAGLAGSTPHMISASITALARILFEFRAELDEASIAELVGTIDLFLTSANREIVRSCLGFVKVCVLSLPTEMMAPRLETLIPNLCVWSKEHKAQFKAKVKHIFERMIRRFGVETVERWTPEADRGLVKNIRKTRERQKRRKEEEREQGEEMDVDDDAGAGKRKGRFESEYDEVLEGSEESESDISDDEVLGRAVARGKARAAKGKRGEEKGTFITEDDDEPLDLLDKRALAHVSSTKPLRKGEAKQEKRKAKTDIDGKLVFNESEDEMEFDDEGKLDGQDPGDGTLEGGINAYVEAIKSKHVPRQGLKGKLKFKNVRGEDDEVDEDEVKDAIKANKASPSGRGRPAGRGDRGGRPGQMNGRKGLGIEKQRGPSGPSGNGVRKQFQAGRGSNKFRPKGGSRGGARGGARGGRR